MTEWSPWSPYGLDELLREAEEHARLVGRLERLADLGGDDEPRQQAFRGDVVDVEIGDLVVTRAQGRWRYGVVTALVADGKRLRVSYLVPSALERAQKTWAATSRKLSAPGYRTLRAREAQQGITDPETAWTQAVTAFRDAVFETVVAARCPRRPWAAVVPPRHVDRPRAAVYRILEDPTTLIPLPQPPRTTVNKPESRENTERTPS